MSLLLQDEQVLELEHFETPRAAMISWRPEYVRASRPVAGGLGPCLLYDVRGCQAIAMRVYDMTMQVMLGSMRADRLRYDPEKERRA